MNDGVESLINKNHEQPIFFNIKNMNWYQTE